MLLLGLRWPRIAVATVVAGVLAWVCVAHAQLPTLGSGESLSPAAERRLGERIVRELYRDPDYLEDAVLDDHVDALWQPLLAAARQRGDLPPALDERLAMRVLLSRDRSVNAFALPGGYFGLHLGLIALTASADELASVLAHELSHATQRHIARLLAQQDRQAPWLLGAMILGAIAAAKNPDAANAVLIGGQAVAAQQQLNFSRDMEREADRLGLAVLIQAGFSAQGFVSMFERLAQSSRLTDSGAFPYLRSHPLTSERMADLRGRLELVSSPSVARASASSAAHALMAARARVLSTAGVDGLRDRVREAQSSLAQRPTAERSPSPAALAATLYGGALAAIRLRDPETARGLLDQAGEVLAGDEAANRLLRLLRVEHALASGQAAQAWAVLGPAGDRRPERLARAEVALALGDGQAMAQAIGGLETWLSLHPQDAAAWQALSRLRSAQGQPVQAVRADAEAQAARGDLAAAVERLRGAQSLLRDGRGAADHIEASIVDARRRALESALREQALER